MARAPMIRAAAPVFVIRTDVMSGERSTSGDIRRTCVDLGEVLDPCEHEVRFGEIDDSIAKGRST
jgi:hypothetical protein